MAYHLAQAKGNSIFGWFRQCFRSAQARPTPRTRNPRRARLALEPLEDRVMPALQSFLMIPAISGGVSWGPFARGIAVDTFSWNVANPVSVQSGAAGLSSGLPQLGDLQFSCKDFPGAAQLYTDAVTRVVIPEVVFAASTPEQIPFMTWDAKDVAVTSFKEVGTGLKASYNFSLAYASITVSSLAWQSGVVTGVQSGASWNAITNTGASTAPLTFGVPLKYIPPAGLTIGGNPEDLASYKFGTAVSAPGTAAAGPQIDFDTLQYTSATPEAVPSLFAVLTTGRSLDKAVLKLSIPAPVTTWTLTDVHVTSLAVTVNNAIQFSCTMAPSAVALSVAPGNPAGKASTAVTSWDQRTGQAVAPTPLTFGDGSTATADAFALVIGGKTLSVFDPLLSTAITTAASSSNSLGSATQSFTFSIGMSQVVPSLFYALTSGMTFDQVEYVATNAQTNLKGTWTMSQVSITAVGAVRFGNATSTVAFTLRASSVQFAKSPVAPPLAHLPTLPSFQPLTANAGGPYAVNLGSGLTFDGSRSNGPIGNQLTYAWDISLAGVPAGAYTDAAGVKPTVSWEQLNLAGVTGPGSYTVRLCVSDGHGNTAYATPTSLVVKPGAANVAILLQPPTGSSGYVVGQVVMAAPKILTPFGTAPYTYIWTWIPSGGTPITAQAPQLAFTPQNAGKYTIILTVLSSERIEQIAQLSLLVIAQPSP
jgi:type VI protein secretion system component Hcp